MRSCFASDSSDDIVRTNVRKGHGLMFMVTNQQDEVASRSRAAGTTGYWLSGRGRRLSTARGRAPVTPGTRRIVGMPQPQIGEPPFH